MFLAAPNIYFCISLIHLFFSTLILSFFTCLYTRRPYSEKEKDSIGVDTFLIWVVHIRKCQGEPWKNVQQQQKRVRHGWESLCHVFVSPVKIKRTFLWFFFSFRFFSDLFMYLFILVVHILLLILTDLHFTATYIATPPTPVPPACAHALAMWCSQSQLFYFHLGHL